MAYSNAKNSGPLSRSKQLALAGLIAAGPGGATSEALAEVIWPSGTRSGAALRMSIARLRDHLPPGTMPEAVDGRYRLDVPVDQVDVWQLQHLSTSGLPPEVDSGALLHLLNPCEAFAGLPESELVTESGRVIRHAQRVVLDQLATTRPELLRGDFLEHLRQHVELDEYNESLLALFVTALGRSGARREALNVLRAATARFVESGLSLAAPLAALELQLLGGELEVGATLPAVDVTTEVPAGLREVQVGTYVGHNDLVGELAGLLTHATGTSRVILTGRSGLGKTRLGAELAARAASRGATVVYATASANGETAFGPLLASLPGLRRRAESIFASGLEPVARKAAFWNAASLALSEAADGGALVLIVDDCQWLDSQTAELIDYLARNTLDHRLVLVVVGREESTTTPWQSLANAMRQVGVAIEVELQPLGPDDVQQLIDDVYPALSASASRQLAGDLHRASNGIPAVVSLVLSSLDDEFLTLPALRSFSPDRLLESVVTELDQNARTVGAIASLVGPDFDLAVISSISALDTQTVLEAVDQLVRRDLAYERSADDFAMTHVLIQAAFIRQTLAHQLSSWHRAAAEYFADNVHRRARHEAESTEVPAEQAVASLLESAQRHLVDGLYREAVADFRLATVDNGDALSPDADGHFARALDLCGMGAAARRVRADAVGRALAADDHEAALRVATSGLPESEPIDGDDALVAQLFDIDVRKLGDSAAHDHASHLSRQLAIVGRIDDATDFANRSHALVQTESDLCRSAVVARFAMSATAPPERRLKALAVASDAVANLAPSERSEFAFLRSIDRYEAGDVGGAMQSSAQLFRDDESTPPLRRWHGLLFEAMRLTDAGLADEAKAARDAAFEFGVRYGIGEATNARFAPDFVDVWLRGQHGLFADVVEDGSLIARHSALGRAASSVILLAVGETGRAVSMAETLAKEVLNSPVSQGTAALAVIAAAVAESPDRSLVAAVDDMLALRGRSLLVVGASVCSIGPVARYRAHLVGDAQQQHELRTEALALADESSVSLWRAVCRVDLDPASGTVDEHLVELLNQPG